MSQAEPKKKILITDDDKSTTLLLSAIFKDNFQVETAHNSREAILKIHEFQPDLITSDINMPGLEGDDLLPIIRAWKPHIPVLVISGSIDPGIQEKCIDRGASGFIAKPFEKTSLREQVQTVITGEVPAPIISEKIINEVELAICILEREGLITREQSKEEFSNVKCRMKI